MEYHCPPNNYFDALLQSCQSCSLLCISSPPRACQRFCATTADAGSPDKDTSWIIWLTMALIAVLILTVFMMSILLGKKLKKRKEHGDSCQETNAKDNNETENKINNPVLETVCCNEVRRQAWQNEEVEVRVYDFCDKALSDYLFPLPAIEEGAAILVTTKTSVCCNPVPGVKGDAFVEI
ncbi:tumor necrosis factor receptor superfamily member 17 [Pelobates fuscus]|uniref:tumor necrosis factor receptor superfamily member 17 n=1 Tax=Pelobates fuscus TaxID=191477 RepID=UPI002FE485AB